jgi:hypothetical protein
MCRSMPAATAASRKNSRIDEAGVLPDTGLLGSDDEDINDLSAVGHGSYQFSITKLYLTSGGYQHSEFIGPRKQLAYR